ncbi:cytochrome c-550 PedF [Salinisphaera aquimarina]|uniref:Cytochrome c-550 PedF n=1 Tax=Salinisphaera aquimarina TaxID=2094031 RepID=A0ABV7EKS7_9GAMM
MIQTKHLRCLSVVMAGVLAVATTAALAHGNVVPQPVETEGLKPLPEGQWLTENPYRGNKTAIEIGDSGFNENCARCHGLQAISGGIAPDLRELGPEYDEYFIGHVRNGVHRNGMTYMPAFEGVLSQEAMWAIRSYIDKRYYEYNDKNLDDLYKQADEQS